MVWAGAGNHIGMAGFEALLLATEQTTNPWLQHVRIDGQHGGVLASELDPMQEAIRSAIAGKINTKEL